MNDFERYGFDRTQLSAFLLGCDPAKIRQKVILAPCWSPESVGIEDARLICDGAHRIWDCSLNAIAFTYIVSGVGAGTCSDVVMSLAETACRQILFMGSAGSIHADVAVGDLAVPARIICGDGACRYLSADLRQDPFGAQYAPAAAVRAAVLDAARTQARELGISCHAGTGASVETIYSQFSHLDTFLEMECDFLDMESAAFLRSAQAAGIAGAVIFCISDNAIRRQSLVTVSEEMTRFRKDVRRRLMPGVMTAFLAAQ